MPDQTKVDSFTEFVTEVEPRLRRALTASFGAEVGREAAAEALVYGWKHRDRVREMGNPAGYLYRVGRDRGRHVPKPVGRLDLDAAVDKVPWVEPTLPGDLRRLPERQRIVFTLIHTERHSGVRVLPGSISRIDLVGAFGSIAQQSGSLPSNCRAREEQP